MSQTRLTGHCYCGAVKFEISGDAEWIGHCHCESCRRASGSVMTSFAEFRRERVAFTGIEPARYATEDGVTRSFCPHCGSPVAYEYSGEAGKMNIQLGLFDDLEPLKPQDHSFREEKPGWFQVDEQLPDSNWTRES